MTEQYEGNRDDRSFRDSSRPTLPHREAPFDVANAEARVLVATRDRASLLQLKVRLMGRATVLPVHDERELIRLAGRGRQRVVLVLDCCAPAMRILDAALALETYLPGLPIIVWGGDPAGPGREALSPSITLRWHRLPSDADIQTLARLAETLL